MHFVVFVIFCVVYCFVFFLCIVVLLPPGTNPFALSSSSSSSSSISSKVKVHKCMFNEAKRKLSEN